MKVDTNYNKNNLDKFPDEYTLPSENQKVGTIAVYQFETDLTEESTEGYSLAGVNINKYHPLTVKQTWAGIDSTKNMPKQTIIVQDADGNKISKDLEVPEGVRGESDREFFIPAVKKWKISTKVNPERWLARDCKGKDNS